MAKLVIFDCDGTLVDSQHRIYDAMCNAFQSAGLDNPHHSAVRRVIGLSMDEAMMAVAPEQSLATHKKMIEAFKATYLKRHAESLNTEPLYDGIRDVVMSLHRQGYDLAVATGKSQRGLVRVLEAHKMKGQFISLQTADFHPSKPHPSMVLTCLADSGAAPEEAVVIGDTSYDMAMARAANVAALGVSWGYHEPQELLDSGADHVVDQVSQLEASIARLLDA